MSESTKIDRCDSSAHMRSSDGDSGGSAYVTGTTAPSDATGPGCGGGTAYASSGV